MPRVREAVVALRGDESGLTLIELMVAATLGLVVVGAALSMFLGGVRSEPRTASKVAAIQQARTTLDRITRELRQGIEVTDSSNSELSIVTYVKAASCGGAPGSTAIPCEVTYTCATTSCSRLVAQPDGSAPSSPVVVASDLASPLVFSYEPDDDAPSYVGVTFTFASEDGDPVTLGDGVALRNFEDEGPSA
jgi:Tfp pilus assembly protein PilW